MHQYKAVKLGRSGNKVHLSNVGSSVPYCYARNSRSGIAPVRGRCKEENLCKHCFAHLKPEHREAVLAQIGITVE